MLKPIFLASFALSLLSWGQQDTPKTMMSATDRHRAREVLVMAFSSAMKLESGNARDDLLERIGMMQIKLGGADVAAKTFAELDGGRCRRNCLQKLYIAQNRLDLLQNTFEGQPQADLDWELLSISVQFAEAGRLADAVKMAKTIQGGRPREEALSKICQAVDDIKHFDELTKITADLSLDLYKTNAYRHLARMKARNGDSDGCLKVTHLIKSGTSRNVLRRDLALILAGRKDLKSVERVIGDFPTADRRAEAWVRCALLMAEAGDLETAREFHDRVKTSDLTIVNKRRLGVVKVHLGDLDGAVRFAKDNGFDVSYKVAIKQLEQSPTDAFRTAALIKRPRYAADAFAKIAVALHKSGKKEASEKALKAAETRARESKSSALPGERIFALTHVAWAKIHMKHEDNPELQLAVEAMQKSDRKDKNSVTYGILAEALAEAGRFANAVAVAKWSDYAWEKMMHLYVKSDLENALRVSVDTKWKDDQAKKASVTVEIWVSETGDFEKAVKWCRRQKPQVQAATLCAAVKGWQKFQGKKKPVRNK